MTAGRCSSCACADPHFRRMWGGPLHVVSGYRTAAYNASLIAEGHNPARCRATTSKGRAARPDAATLYIEGRDTVLELHDMILCVRMTSGSFRNSAG